MPITFDVFDSESRAPKGRIHIFWLNWEDLPRLYDPALSDHVVKITDKHPILHDIDIPRIPTFDLDPPITELSGGTGFGASVKEDRVTTFHDLRALIDRSQALVEGNNDGAGAFYRECPKWGA
ncbi:hypothetical protein UCREL1_8635 [Eutypa lata UCREL1]|uniref:Uncharacterized protein n=1 Tax=Eutypa lata (strain UCR-EL1) TaxID=1287681 RepID=M7SJB7_EUTLA|nr:hypothetical protein UCREL1_8635 [Eutypa lata UCREL1]